MWSLYVENLTSSHGMAVAGLPFPWICQWVQVTKDDIDLTTNATWKMLNYLCSIKIKHDNNSHQTASIIIHVNLWHTFETFITGLSQSEVVNVYFRKQLNIIKAKCEFSRHYASWEIYCSISIFLVKLSYLYGRIAYFMLHQLVKSVCQNVLYN